MNVQRIFRLGLNPNIERNNMEIEEIKQFLKENEENPEVQRFVDSLADKRVTQARSKWEEQLPERLEKELKTRAETERARVERETQVQESLIGLLAEKKVQMEYAEPFLPSNLAEIADEALPEIVESIATKALEHREKIHKTIWAGKPPMGSNNPMVESTDKFKQSVLNKALRG